MPRDGSSEYDEYRICGTSSTRGDWSGSWRQGEPDDRGMYDIRQMAARNDRVWIERRHVVITSLGSQEVQG